MNVVSITAVGYLVLILLGATVFVLSLASVRKETHLGKPMLGIIWFALAIVCLYAMVLLGEYLEKARALNRAYNHVEARLSRGPEHA